MAARMYRTQILLEPEQQQALAEVARREGRSISDVVREMIRRQLEQRQQLAAADLQRRVAALDRIRQHREDVLRRHEGKPLDLDVAELIREMREERDEHNLVDFDHRR